MKILCVTAIGLLCVVFSSSYGLNTKNDKRIIGGSQAERNQFPYMVAIHHMEPEFFMCAGAIIHPKIVVTAAHCLKGWRGPFKVIAGSLHIRDYHKDVQTVYGSTAFIPDEFEPGLPYSDYALIKLSAPLTYNEAVKPVAQAKGGKYSGNATLAGWGIISMNPPLLATTMQYIEMPIITNEECNKILAKSPDAVYLVKNTLLCTLPPPDKTACWGDYGGPLVQNGTLVGISVPGSCREGSPNVFAHVGVGLASLVSLEAEE